MGFTGLDVGIVFLYLISVTLFGIWLGKHQQNTKDYFLGNRNLPWTAISFSVVATETSTLTFISIPGLAYITNLMWDGYARSPAVGGECQASPRAVPLRFFTIKRIFTGASRVVEPRFVWGPRQTGTNARAHASPRARRAEQGIEIHP